MNVNCLGKDILLTFDRGKGVAALFLFVYIVSTPRLWIIT